MLNGTSFDDTLNKSGNTYDYKVEKFSSHSELEYESEELELLKYESSSDES